MRTRKLLGKLVLSIGLLGMVLPAPGCRRNRGYDSYSSYGVDFSWFSFDMPAFFGYDEYYYEETTFVDDGGFYDSEEYDYYEDWGGKGKKADRRK